MELNDKYIGLNNLKEYAEYLCLQLEAALME